ncbi:MAG: hypothetical protein UY68_C0012G0010 [Parcubacteria group bacterium GW2011_GWF2_52_12]|nr:MAG: hypothetical protein UY68_C0012G0010 [Parcubacteria group bacterium GW2011_GWF2_52_12]KKW26003.1 MAG: hypothetical protein UY69_C0040G0004 [Parcubacteria group bacterium GW2011_GWF1_52_5]
MIIILVVIVLGASVGGYTVYKKSALEKVRYAESVQNLQGSESEVRVGNTVNPSTTTIESRKPEPRKPITVNTSVVAKLNCDNDWQCLISAAKKCQNASGVITYSSLPVFEMVLQSGKNKYEIKSSNAGGCTLTYSFSETSVIYTAKARATMLAQGMTNANIDVQLKEVNEDYKMSAGIPTTCVSNGATISAYLSDLQKGSSKVHGTSRGNVTTETYTTSSGQTMVCTRQEPDTTVITYPSTTN